MDVRPKPAILDDLEINLDKYSGANRKALSLGLIVL